ncbi:hypothetical protein EAI89_23150 [Eubacterium sp. am_0171]|uniref:hypothetical protein n=1 Tax=unclassified Eubacterium (in: firmicutes) TaxID=2624479 RepID=UPI0010209927|nr:MULTISPECIES: hypothetical protein [unclassified Eubacterium (in: firmicutes)]MSC86681.1 hypothetical protein [Eubacterium sp. BIOML-A1]MSD08885.1 hypothetical protein [Eubacterium sp. BIOML-A2]RYT09679.1 hypothetical protein EAI89_23150 [Eubacterium sp. am_0171]
MLYIILIAIAIIIVVIISRGRDKNQSSVGSINQDTPTTNKREPLDEAAIQEYTANMEDAYNKLINDGRDVYPGFPWSAVFSPSTMRNILRGEDSLVDSPNYDLHLEGIGRFKMSIQAYARYGVPPTGELIDYIDNHYMNPELDDALAWYKKMH